MLPPSPDPLPEPAERPSHLVTGEDGATRARMVDVSEKAAGVREALAAARLRFPAGVLSRLLAGEGPKGAVAEVARTAGVLAAKRTAELIPLCHPLGLDFVDVEFERLDEDRLEVRCRARTRAQTGVEMEGLVGAALAALTVYDMGKGLDKGIVIESLQLLEKSGGRSGTWRAQGGGRPA